MIFLRIKSFFVTIGLILSLLYYGGINYYTENHVYREYYYGSHSRQCLDLVIPKECSGDTGLVLFIHGGGYTEGSKEEYLDMLLEGARMYNVAFASINYRYVSNSTGFDEILDDVTTALNAIKSLGAQKGVNINKMILNGTSAGGHISLLYAYKYRETSPIKPVGVVSFCGPTDFSDPTYYNQDMYWYTLTGGREYLDSLLSKCIKETINAETYEGLRPKLLEYSPLYYVDSNTVPTSMYHGKLDAIVPYSNAVTLASALETNGVEYELHTCDTVGHNIYEDKAFANDGLEEICRYIERYLINN